MGILNNIIKNKFKNNKLSSNNKNFAYDSTIGFIWGVKSVSDYSEEEASPFTINDIALYCDENTGEYTLFIETARCFEKDKKDECKFLKRIFAEFTEWMICEGYDVNKKYDFAFVATENLMKFVDTSIERIYARFKIFVSGFLAIYG